MAYRKASPPFLATAAKTTIWLSAWLVVAFYAMVWIIMPVRNGDVFYDSIYDKFGPNKQFGYSGVSLILFTGPFIVLTIIACFYVELEKAYPSRKHAGSQWSVWRRLYQRLWTQPILVQGPFGLMTAAEIVGFVMLAFVILWQFWKYTIMQFEYIDSHMGEPDDPYHMSKSMQKFEYVAVMLGWVALVPLALLFLPVTRGSPVLKMIDIPFEHAVKYHVWLGHMTMVLVVAHGICYGIFYGLNKEIHTFVAWQRTGIANLPGVIAVVAGMLMWATSFAVVRRRFFNLFFNIHQLYVVFFAFAAWHLGVELTGYFLGATFLFFVDRFLRFLQSRKVVTGASARVLHSGIVELKLPISSNLCYSPLSFMFLNIRGLSRLEWHPFSTSSTPLDSASYMSIGIKPLGDWTDALHKSVLAGNATSRTTASGVGCPFSLKLFAEGPYGHESDYFLRYKHLLLVAGGIGVTPFMAIIQDILFRYRLEQDGLPSTIKLIWCVKRRSELSTLEEVYPTRIFPKYGKSESDFRIDVKIYITGEHLPIESTSAAKVSPLNVELEVMGPNLGSNGGSTHEVHSEDQDFNSSKSLTPVILLGNNLRLAAIICASTTGMVLFIAFFHVYVYNPHTDEDIEGKQLAGWIDVLLFLVALLVGVVVFGGAVVFGSWIACKYFVKLTSTKDLTAGAGAGQRITQFADVEDNGTNLVDQGIVSVGSRPNFSDLFNEARGEFGDADVGVLLCGPESLQVDVASECRSQGFKQWKTQFHYHSVSFDL